MKKILFKLHFMNFASRAVLIALMFSPTIYGAANNDEKLNKQLFDAVESSELETIKKLINDGAKIEEAKSKHEGNTPLMVAVQINVPSDIFEFLLKNGANNIKAKNTKKGLTALMMAADLNSEFIEKLIQAGANIEAKDKQGNTALIWAARYHPFFDDTIVPVKKLIQAGANIEAKDKQGNTALIWAAKEGHLKSVQALIKAGATIDRQDKEKGKTALMWVVNRSSFNLPLYTDKHLRNIAKELLIYGADPHIKDNTNRTVLNQTLNDTAMADIIKTAINFYKNNPQKKPQKEMLSLKDKTIEFIEKEGIPTKNIPPLLLKRKKPLDNNIEVPGMRDALANLR